MIAMIAVSWAMSTVISIPPLFGLKDPLVGEDRLHNFTSSHFLQAAALPDTVDGSFHPPLISGHVENYALENDWNDQADSTILWNRALGSDRKDQTGFTILETVH